MRSSRKLRVAATCTAGIALIAIVPRHASAQASEGQAVAEGARVYGLMCGRCHNPRSPLEHTDRAWVTIVNHMRVRGNLTGKQVRTVVAFLQATNTSPAERAPLPAGAAAPAPGPGLVSGPVSNDPEVIGRGRTLVDQKACLGCHVIGNAGGQVGPTLNDVVGRRGADLVRRKLADPAFNNATSMMPNFGLSSEEIEAIVAYLASLGRR